MRTLLPVNAITIPTHAERVFKGIIYDVYHWQQQLFDGSHATFERLKRPDTVEVIVVKDNKIITLVDEQPDRPPVFTLPGGRHDVESEDEYAAAARELHEETGLVCANWKLIAIKQPNPKIDWFIYTFIATNIQQQDEPHTDPGEHIAISEINYEQFMRRSNEANVHIAGLEFIQRAGSIKGLLDMPDISGDTAKVKRVSL